MKKESHTQKKAWFLVGIGVSIVVIVISLVTFLFPYNRNSLKTSSSAPTTAPLTATSVHKSATQATRATAKEMLHPTPSQANSLNHALQQPASQSISGPSTYHVVGKQIIDSNGNSFTPYGVQLDGILMAQPASWRSDLTYLTQAQVQAAHDFWHANTISLQISSKALFDQSPYDKDYIATTDNVVGWAKQLGMNVLLVLQYQGAGNSGQQMPTQDSLNFWDVLSKHYATSTNVFFDIFNEPTPGLVLGVDDNDNVWEFWKNGGAVNGVTYMGMQQLVNSIRNNGFSNLIFVDGAASAQDINLLPKHLLSDNNIVYAIHPYLDTVEHAIQAQWDVWFGNATTSGNFPVVADEWGQYQDYYSFDTNVSCVTNAPTVVPQFLTYLHNKNIGLIGFALFPGTLIRGWNFTQPTKFDSTTASCSLANFPDESATAQGAGELLVQYFATYSH